MTRYSAALHICLHHFYLAYCTWVGKHKQASKSSLRAEVDYKPSLSIYTHAGRVQCTCKDTHRHVLFGYIIHFQPHLMDMTHFLVLLNFLLQTNFN